MHTLQCDPSARPDGIPGPRVVRSSHSSKWELSFCVSCMNGTGLAGLLGGARSRVGGPQPQRVVDLPPVAASMPRRAESMPRRAERGATTKREEWFNNTHAQRHSLDLPTPAQSLLSNHTLSPNPCRHPCPHARSPAAPPFPSWRTSTPESCAQTARPIRRTTGPSSRARAARRARRRDSRSQPRRTLHFTKTSDIEM